MSNFVEIANSAATWIGTQGGIVDPDDNRLLARTVRQVWDMQRRATLREGEWNFACERGRLPALAETPVPYGFAYWYEKPATALRLVELIDEPRDRYRFEGGRILTDLAPPVAARWIVDVPEPALWDESFADAFAKRIAMHIGKRIAGSAYSLADGQALYKEALASAKSVDARENPPLEQEECAWIEARFGSVPVDPARWG